MDANLNSNEAWVVSLIEQILGDFVQGLILDQNTV
jgi:hypothetical protein